MGARTMSAHSPLAPFLEQNGFVVLDGGLATELEERGHELDDPLWSANLLLTEPDAIRDVHRSYLEAGADCLITATYQASIPGLRARGLSDRQAAKVLSSAVAMARDVRDEMVEHWRGRNEPRLRPIVAASVGPYGAFLADGSEYRGRYGVSRDDLRAFHEPRWEALSDSGADLLACETIPDVNEAEVLLELFEQTPGARGWISFSCRDGESIRDGTPLTACAALFEGCQRVIAVGANCTAPRHIASLIRCARRGAPGKNIVVYSDGTGNRVKCVRIPWPSPVRKSLVGETPIFALFRLLSLKRVGLLKKSAGS